GGCYQWGRDMADMLMLAVLAYMVAGAAVSLGYFEVIYMVVMLMELLRMHVVRACAESTGQMASSMARAAP
ncbi:MAG: putative O-glycosylation ligase, exosortase A system-associated, partial [Proteobacteria bacterium]|nr:putative O-glycosylation ligase, exosortase A system-associated [Pseudomonadota bacterium]